MDGELSDSEEDSDDEEPWSDEESDGDDTDKRYDASEKYRRRDSVSKNQQERFECNQCDRSYKTIFYLNTHKLIHLGEYFNKELLAESSLCKY